MIYAYIHLHSFHFLVDRTNIVAKDASLASGPNPGRRRNESWLQSWKCDEFRWFLWFRSVSWLSLLTWARWSSCSCCWNSPRRCEERISRGFGGIELHFLSCAGISWKSSALKCFTVPIGCRHSLQICSCGWNQKQMDGGKSSQRAHAQKRFVILECDCRWLLTWVIQAALNLAFLCVTNFWSHAFPNFLTS